jgi:uncharacterized protein (DUF305 family)
MSYRRYARIRWQAAAAAVGAGLMLGLPTLAAAQNMDDMPGMKMTVAVAPIPAGADYTAADVAFMQGMIIHHMQALKMAAMAPTHDAGRDVAIICKKITISQNDDITFMKTWLADRNQPAPAPDDPTMMAGMLTAAQMAQLDSARGRAFDRLFLTGMIQHHAGALMMVKDLFAAPGAGQASEMFRFASDVDADQRAEIGRMQKLLNSLQGSPAKQ